MRERRGTLVLATLWVAVFVCELAVGVAGRENALLSLGALRTLGWSGADAWRILTFSFLHLTWWHLASNAGALVWLGGIVERRMGSAVFAAIAAAGGLASGAAGMLLGRYLPTTGIMVGASGVVCGLLAAALLLVFVSPRSAPASDEDRRLQRPLLLALLAVAGVSLLPGVSLAGHLGGFVGGASMASWCQRRPSPAGVAKGGA